MFQKKPGHPWHTTKLHIRAYNNGPNGVINDSRYIQLDTTDPEFKGVVNLTYGSWDNVNPNLLGLDVYITKSSKIYNCQAIVGAYVYS